MIARTITSRLVSGVIVLLTVTFVIFVLIDLAPGNPATSVLGREATAEQREEFAEEHGLNDPIPVRYVRFLGDVARGDLGRSFVQPADVGDLIVRAFPKTAQLTLMATVIAMLLALTVGVGGALFRRRWPDRLLEGASVVGVASPEFWLGLMAISLFAIQLQWLPSGGYVEPSESLSGWFRSMLLPATALAVPLGSAVGRILRSSLGEELQRDYIRTARGLGLHPIVIVGRNGLRNALLTPMTALGLRIGYLLSGAIIVESIFDIPGMGFLLLNAVNQGDVAVVQGLAIVGATGVVIVNLIVDLLYIGLNPRLREPLHS